MSKQRRKHSPALKAKVALEAVRVVRRLERRSTPSQGEQGGQGVRPRLRPTSGGPPLAQPGGALPAVS